MARKADSELITHKLTAADMRKFARSFVHFKFITVGKTVNLDDYGFNVIDGMPSDLSAANENIELQIPTFMAVYGRIFDMIKHEHDAKKASLEQAKDNIVVKEAEIARDLYTGVIKVEFRTKGGITEKAVNTYVCAHHEVINLKNTKKKLEGTIREKASEMDMIKSAIDALKAYHKGLEIFVKRMTAGIHYADLPHAHEETKPRHIPNLGNKEDLLTLEDDPREGFNSWKKA